MQNFQKIININEDIFYSILRLMDTYRYYNQHKLKQFLKYTK